ncbi:MAG: hypothetical protein E7258_03115 [Lachnospiraceae bacterium]|nr:hypothetical protein [Lachnospiraceae bacterium]
MFGQSKVPVNALSNADNIRGCWISYLDIETRLKDLSEEEFETEVINMYNKVLENNLNTVIVQVRTMGDAIYPSQYFPWSNYISTDRKAPSYDPLEIMINIAKKMRLRFEAWINPYRISLNTTGTNSFKGTKYYDLYKHHIMEYSNANGETCICFDPSKEETIELISNGVKEIVEKYDIDGIHFDDYFYVSGMANELEENQKKEYVNQMVKKVYDTVKETDVSCEFGISPAGNLDNARSQGADIDTWLSVEGYIDYIMPQIYWTDMFVTEEGNKTMFTDRCKEWMEINILDLPIYIGLALYRVGENSSTDIGWSIKDVNLKEQYETALDIGCDGYVLFRYEWLEKELSNNELNNLLSYVNGMFVYSYLQNSYISYTVCGENKDWSDAKKDGITAKSEGAPLWGIVINLGEKVEDGYVIYRTQHSDYTYSPWCPDGTLCYDGKNITNVQIMLKGEVSKEYDVYYRCKLFDYGWTSWVSNGMLPLENNQLNVEGIQIKMIKKT